MEERLARKSVTLRRMGRVWPLARIASYLAAVAFAALFLPIASAASGAEVVWRMATEYPSGNISGIGLATFKRLVEERTGGMVSTDNAFDNALKISSGAMLRAAAERQIDGGDAFAGPLESSDAVFGLPSLPFVTPSVEAARSLNAAARPLYERALAERGLKLLYVTIWPPTGIWSAGQLRTEVDLRTLAIRTYDENSAAVLRATGATANYLSFNEALALVKARKLNAILTSGDGGAGRKLWDDLRHFTPINYAIPVSLAFVRQDAFAALPASVQEEVVAAAAETERSQFALLADRTAENYQRMRANGVSIDEPVSSAILSALRTGAKAPIAAWRAKVSVEAAALLDGLGRR